MYVGYRISAVFLEIKHSIYAFTNIINNSVFYKNFPTRWKKALVKAIPKSSNPTCALDYQPISLLPVFSKLIEKLIAKQMTN